MRSPEPGQSARPVGAYNVDQKGKYSSLAHQATTALMNQGPQYYAQAIAGHDANGGYQQGPNQYYQPQHTHQAAQHPSYGPVTYYTNAPATHAALGEFESRKRGFDALDSFFGEVRRRQFDPISYQNVSQRLFELQGLQLPMITQQPLSAIPAYQPISAMAGGGYSSHNDPMQAYSLPPLGNAKTRGDLTSIDHILEQMQATIYENDNTISQAGIGQPGSQYVAYRTSSSPPAAHLAASHAQNLMHQHSPSISSAADSIHGVTPALTPPSSAQSYTSGQSPISHHAMTPIQGPTSSAMYPTLPATSGGLDYSSHGATLGGYADGDYRRRLSGGMLQRAQPARRGDADADMDMDSTGSATPPASRKTARGKGKALPIDPALSGDGKMAAESPKGEMSQEELERQQAWVNNMRLIEWMRDYVKKRLENGEFEEEGSVGGTENEKKDEEMEDASTPKADDGLSGVGLYPTLKVE